MAFNFTIVFIVFKKIRTFQKIDGTGINSKVKTDWLIRLLNIGFFICAAWLIALTLTLYLNHQNKNFFYVLWLSISFLVYWLGYAAIYQLNIYKERKYIQKKYKSTILDAPSVSKESPLLNKFENLIVENQLFLNPELKQPMVAEMMGITSNYLSKVLNENGSLNFSDYINGLRVQKAKNFLISEDFKNYTNTAVGLESGFNSKSTFFKAFKKYNGITPSEYKKSVVK